MHCQVSVLGMKTDTYFEHATPLWAGSVESVVKDVQDVGAMACIMCELAKLIQECM